MVVGVGRPVLFFSELDRGCALEIYCLSNIGPSQSSLFDATSAALPTLCTGKSVPRESQPLEVS